MQRYVDNMKYYLIGETCNLNFLFMENFWLCYILFKNFIENVSVGEKIEDMSTEGSSILGSRVGPLVLRLR